MSTSDKGKGMVVMTLKMYDEITKRHTTGDAEVGWDELKKAQRTATAHARSLACIFQVGDSSGERNKRG